jgi:hypothetical protein
MVKYACLCPEECGDQLLPVDLADCLSQYVLETSEISDVFLSIEDPDNPGQPLYGPTDWTSAADWAAAIDNDTAAGVLHLQGIGDKPAAEEQEVTVDRFQLKVLNRTHTLNFDVLHMTDNNYEFGRSIQCGATFVMWFATTGGYIYGGQNGFTVNAKANFVKERGEGSFASLQLIFTWKAICDPPRAVSPFAEVEAGE